MKGDPYIYNVLNTYASENMLKERDDSNVIKLRFDSETKGSA